MVLIPQKEKETVSKEGGRTGMAGSQDEYKKKKKYYNIGKAKSYCDGIVRVGRARAGPKSSSRRFVIGVDVLNEKVIEILLKKIIFWKDLQSWDSWT